MLTSSKRRGEGKTHNLKRMLFLGLVHFHLFAVSASQEVQYFLHASKQAEPPTALRQAPNRPRSDQQGTCHHHHHHPRTTGTGTGTTRRQLEGKSMRAMIPHRHPLGNNSGGAGILHSIDAVPASGKFVTTDRTTTTTART